MYQALYRKYRPKTFDEVVGQDIIVKTLKNSIKNNIVSHAYLLSGPRGTGKTSIAKIFAKTLNCYNPTDDGPCNECISCQQANNNQNIDIIEIDAASNNGVDEIREIRNKITLVPTNSKYKIYIIDEVHMLTNQAFNALLKTLEEPPSHIIFIFATTEPQKIPRTILSRCQRFDYKKVSVKSISERLKIIAEKENIDISDEALCEIARLSDGGVRDSISLLDQTLAYCDEKITLDDIHSINGTLNEKDIEELIIDILNNDFVNVISKIDNYDNDGKNIYKIVQEIIEKMKDSLIYLNAPNLINGNKEFFETVKSNNNYKVLYKYIKCLSALTNDMKNSNNSRLLFEIELIKNMNDSDNMGNISQTEVKTQIDSNIKIIEESKKKDNSKEINVEEKNEICFNKDKLEKLKQIRIKNSLCKFSQKEREKLKQDLDKINELISDEKYGKYVSLIKDGELKAVSKNYLMFMYKTDLMAQSFNLDLIKIEKLFNKTIGDYHAIAINFDDWEFLKKDYNIHKDSYKYCDDIELTEIFNVNNEKNIESNSIDEMFNDIIEYE